MILLRFTRFYLASNCLLATILFSSVTSLASDIITELRAAVSLACRKAVFAVTAALNLFFCVD